MPKPAPRSIAIGAPARGGDLVTPEDLKGWRAWLAGRMPEAGLLVSLLIVAGGLWLFLEIADEMREGELEHIDRALLLLFRDGAGEPLGPAWLEEAMRDLTALGSTLVLTIITLAAAGYLELAGKRRAAVFLVVAIGGGVALGFALKAGFERPRPDLVAHGAKVFSASFPSAHSMLSAIVYLTLGMLLARVQPRRRLRIYLIALAILLTLAIGISRLYLGVHWPSDVLAGWALGASWAMLCWAVVLWLQRKGEVEEPGEAAPEPGS
jgi:undecaprenyl-diphosphatase